MVTRTTKLKNLNIQPLSVAKYFYGKEGIDDYALIQDFLYLTYLEVLKKEGQVLFQEKFQAWENGPMLESVYQQMRYHFEKYGELDSLFAETENVEDKTIKSCLAKVYRDYQNSKKKGGEVDFFFQTQDEPWEQAREKANGERSPHIFMEPVQIMALTN